MRRGPFIAGAAALYLSPQICRASQLGSAVAAAARRLPGTIGVAARTLGPGAPLIAYRVGEIFPTASIVKVLIMATAYAMDEAQPGILAHEMTFDRSRDLIGGSDFMAVQPNGARFSVERLLTPMIVVSDNTAANMLIGFLGIDAINATGTQAGMTQTHLGRKFLDFGAVIHHHDNVTTPADMARLLYVIERGAHEGIPTIASPAHCRTMIEIMLRQTDRDGIPEALPRGTPIANKTGEITGTRNDVAIVNPFGDAPLILAVLTKDVGDYAAAYAAIHTIARATYAATRAVRS